MTHHSWNDQHIKRSLKSFLKALFVTTGVFLVLFSIFRIIGTVYIASIAKDTGNLFDEGIKKDLAHLKEEGNRVAENEEIKRYILTKDSNALIQILREEKQKRSIGLMGVVDADGIVIGRTKTSGKRGDNVFLTEPVGRLVSQGAYAESIETPYGFDPVQLLLNTGRPVFKGGVMIGALFANYLTDNEYAQHFKKTRYRIYIISNTAIYHCV